MRPLQFDVLIGMLAAMMGCGGEPLPKLEPTATWAMLDGGRRRLRYAADVPLAAPPQVVWSYECPLAEPRIATALGDDEVLCLVRGIRADPEPKPERREAIYAMGMRLSDGTEVWRYEAPDLRGWFHEGLTTAFHLAALRDSGLYLATEKGILVIDSRTGKLLRHLKEDWSVNPRDFTCKYPMFMIVGQAGDRLYLADPDGHLRALGATDGKQLWRTRVFKGKPTWFDLAGDAGKVVVVGAYENGRLVVLNPTDGEVVWETDELPRRTLLWPGVKPFGAAIAGRRLLVPASQQGFFEGVMASYLIAFDLETGKALWTSGVNKSYALCVASDGQRAWLASWKELVCFDLRTGWKLWRRSKPRPISAPVVCGEAVLVLCENDVLQGLSATSGKELWKVDLGYPEPRYNKLGHRLTKYRDLIVSGGYVIVVGARHIAALKPRGKAGGAESNPLTAGETGKASPATGNGPLRPIRKSADGDSGESGGIAENDRRTPMSKSLSNR